MNLNFGYMKNFLVFGIVILTSLSIHAQSSDNLSIGLFSFILDFEISNDQGDYPTRDYLKEYGTKGKTRAQEVMYPLLDECMTKLLINKGFNVDSFMILGEIKANVYGYPTMSLNKAIKSNKYNHYLKIVLKDIGQIPPSQLDAAPGQAVKPVKIRCRITLYDSDKNTLKYSEGIFGSGEKVGNKYDLGVDLRQYQGSGRAQELKFYEVCCKMAFLRALENF